MLKEFQAETLQQTMKLFLGNVCKKNLNIKETNNNSFLFSTKWKNLKKEL